MKVLLAILVLAAAGIGFLKYNPDWWPNHKDQILPYLEKIPGAATLFTEQDQVELPALPELADGDPKDSSQVGDNPAGPLAASLALSDTERDYNYYFLREIFLQLRGQELSVEDAQKWMNVLEQGGSRRGIMRALILDDYYYQLQNQQVSPTLATIDFAVHYGDKYLGISYASEDLGQVDFYTLKKELIEKTLRLLDLLWAKKDEASRLNLANWYGVFSAQMAQDYPTLFTDAVRGQKAKAFHRQWALDNDVPYVYSEVIIKLAKVLNQLNQINPSA